MADRGDGDQAQRHQSRNYPLDIPSLPFHRYDHRRLTARDILVHRLMAEFMNPSRAYPTAVFRNWEGWQLTAPGTALHRASEEGRSGHPSASGTIEDYELLERLLFTWDSKWMNPEVPYEDDYEDCLGHVFQAPPDKAYDFGELILDVASRHYFEVDDAAMRVWISRAGRPRPVEGHQPTHHRKSTLQMLFSEYVLGHAHWEGLDWSERYSARLSRLRPKLNIQDQLSLYDGGACLPTLRQTGDMNASGSRGARRAFDTGHWTIREFSYMFPMPTALPSWPEVNPLMRHVLQPPWIERTWLGNPIGIGRLAHHRPLDLSIRAGRGRNCDGIWATGRNPSGIRDDEDGRPSRPRRRCTSEPPPGVFAAAFVPLPKEVHYTRRVQILYARMTLSQLDKRSRRRSLSRGRIEEMFDWDTHLQSSRNAPPTSSIAKTGGSQKPQQQHCENCTSQAHRTPSCRAPCGHCGAPSPNDPGTVDMMRLYPEDPPLYAYVHLNPHQAPDCPVARHNRCKCVAFPTFHTAAQCGIPCRRACGGTGNQATSRRPGSFQHRNAMLCRARCCMCGIRGSHSGRECRQRRCRCGGAHLGQDCGWKPECRVRGCDRFLCGVHCRECGSIERPFVGWRCGRCLGVEIPLEGGEGGRGTKRGGRRRGKKGQGDGNGGEGGQESLEGRGEAMAVVPKADTPAVVTPLAREETEPEKKTETQETEGFKSIFGDPRAKNSTRTSK
ncbi:hypothetical protein C8A01DRAFT_12411 [Parachaetomium inaequale]|uniref:Uncharacterized protein n=1 Tax=Parachaetomium inaequale TaxID=2588326 RepID=A0AAN6SVF9_9PEZI|nr:hypothetical protein C8A01DRAFT_12411 [Parachaetomium inaequale]